MIKLLSYILLGLFFVRCTNSNHKIENIPTDSYLKKLYFFGDSLTNHFPKEYPMQVHEIQSIDTFAYHNTLGFSLLLPDAQNIIGSVLNSKLLSNVYTASDSCLLVVNDYVTVKNCGDNFRAGESTFIEGCSNNKLPVPNFWDIEFATEETRCKLPKDFVLYVLDSKVGIYSKKINIEQSSMPASMKHGYSKGLAISKERNIIIYWVVIW